MASWAADDEIGETEKKKEARKRETPTQDAAL
ncbi:hypothetical protein CCACVL1_30470 [Corchorus capsularis]|uniref:Uncharacterized protein n=1 Tax=Corchorus capsularis TaxID=210143 RepID=A0A1R3FX14_COCAP|nr:hypothetical protein CCACVL1_30470 [Corchorus capsularis]